MLQEEAPPCRVQPLELTFYVFAIYINGYIDFHSIDQIRHPAAVAVWELPCQCTSAS